MKDFVSKYFSLIRAVLIAIVILLMLVLPVHASFDQGCPQCGNLEEYEVSLLAVPEEALSGQRLYTCLVCGYQQEEEIPPTGHVYSPWQEEIAPTTKAEGLRYRLCSKCGEPHTREEAVIPRLNEESVIEMTTLQAEGHEEEPELKAQDWKIVDTVLVGSSGLIFVVFGLLILGDLQILWWYRSVKKEARARFRRGVI
ncbi:rubredoxin [Lachnospiraceae bacterium PF1-21]|uniref:Uncharacterized protein n=1 Tax=Ohessyouella blattaphilus TaxID=2949333 RepID=A0ABT1EL94_9FIRM|nr:hypothetical protein [Ohessyouella blattaphilus]MCP1111473.1 hypothetical protein [Ohessyouella blattaphilus]MCR8564867.1 hypothetical protein [Ohessyouella blattaphilus]